MLERDVEGINLSPVILRIRPKQSPITIPNNVFKRTYFPALGCIPRKGKKDHHRITPPTYPIKVPYTTTRRTWGNFDAVSLGEEEEGGG